MLLQTLTQHFPEVLQAASVTVNTTAVSLAVYLGMKRLGEGVKAHGLHLKEGIMEGGRSVEEGLRGFMSARGSGKYIQSKY